jgi:co-chaperonin GroES (HSP10)
MAKQTLGQDLFKPGGSFRFTHQIKRLHPLGKNVIVRDMNFEGRKLNSGIILLGDDAKTTGIRPRWACVYAVGPEQTDVTPGQWVMIEHGRWSRGLLVEVEGEQFMIRRVDPECIIFVSDQEPEQDATMSDSVHAERKER